MSQIRSKAESVDLDEIEHYYRFADSRIVKLIERVRELEKTMKEIAEHCRFSYADSTTVGKVQRVAEAILATALSKQAITADTTHKGNESP